MPAHLAIDTGQSISEKAVSKMPGGDFFQKAFPTSNSIHLDTLSEYCIKGATGDLEGKNNAKIWTNDMMNKKESI